MLYGDHIRLRGIERADLPTVVGWLNDPATRATVASVSPMSLAQEERWFEGLLKSQTELVFVIDALRPARTPKPRWQATAIGVCGLHAIDWRSRNTTAGIIIGDATRRGQGLGTDAMATLLRHAFLDLGLIRVALDVFPDNVAAQKSYFKLGFTTEGTRRQAIYKEGAFRDLIMMSLLADEWRQRGTPPKPTRRRAPGR
jgi:diamine N-acetyltransferase